MHHLPSSVWRGEKVKAMVTTTTTTTTELSGNRHLDGKRTVGQHKAREKSVCGRARHLHTYIRAHVRAHVHTYVFKVFPRWLTSPHYIHTSHACMHACMHGLFHAYTHATTNVPRFMHMDLSAYHDTYAPCTDLRDVDDVVSVFDLFVTVLRIHVDSLPKHYSRLDTVHHLTQTINTQTKINTTTLERSEKHTHTRKAVKRKKEERPCMIRHVLYVKPWPCVASQTAAQLSMRYGRSTFSTPAGFIHE